MKKFIRDLEKEYLVIAILVAGILLVAFPEQMSRAAPWVLGGLLTLQGIAVVVLCIIQKEKSAGPGRAVLFCVMGVTIMVLGGEATGIIGVIWAVYTLFEVSDIINEMWKEKHIPVIQLILAVISAILAVMLMVDPLKHFVTHVRILGMEIVFSCLVRGVGKIKRKVKEKRIQPETGENEK